MAVIAKLVERYAIPILEVDPGHQVWIQGVSDACDRERPSISGYNPAIWPTRCSWTFVWLVGHDERGMALHNYGIKIEYDGSFDCTVRGPAGRVELKHWGRFPGPDQIITAAMLAGFDWAPRRPQWPR